MQTKPTTADKLCSVLLTTIVFFHMTHCTMIPKLCTPNPKPSTLKPKLKPQNNVPLYLPPARLVKPRANTAGAEARLGALKLLAALLHGPQSHVRETMVTSSLNPV